MDETVKRNGLMGLAAVLVLVAGYMTWNSFGEDPVAKVANTVTCIDAETEEVFKIRLSTDGDMSFPLENRKTGKRTVYPAEICSWNECGERGGTAVLMNEYRARAQGEDSTKVGPTHCPVCGHVVRFRNPRPPPPVTEAKENLPIPQK